MEFKRYRRSGLAEARPYQSDEILDPSVSISQSDRFNGSPKPGDMIARNPMDHSDQWLIAEDYWKQNFEQEPSYD